MTKQEAAAFSSTDGKMNASSGVRSPRRLSRNAPPLGHGRLGPLSMFMENAISCPTCRTVQGLGGKPASRRLHVVIGEDDIAVTEADDLHNPGRTLCGRRILHGSNGIVFRLLSSPPSWVGPARHAPAAGVAVLGWRQGQRTLQVFGVADGLKSHHDCLFDAIEMMPGQD